MTPILSRRLVLAASLALPFAGAAAAQDSWPTKPVHVYVGFPAGSSPDLLARIVAEPLAQRLGQPVVIENRAGAGGVIGIQQMLASGGDNHVFGTTINGPVTTSPRLVDDVGYDVAADIEPVALIATSPLVLAVAGDSGIEDLDGFAQEAGAEPEALSYGSVGQGSGAHLTAELFASLAGVKMLHVPYASYAEVTTAIIGGEIDSGFMAPSAAMEHAAAGNLKMLGVTSAEPFAQIADVPVMAGHAGLPEDFRAELWNAFIAPAGTDPEIIERLNTEINDILSDEDVQKRLLDMGWQVSGGSAEELSERIEADTALWGEVIDRIEAN
ncbi:MAG: tripartite tricarboxylate transporter substrate binding protein [Paracoccus sp. (in: a-proteobacteria)]|nr:tripartite tricarboxylate transporter substrate binding protein [Paracoccus sp. (in: a-proteobacteria)]